MGIGGQSAKWWTVCFWNNMQLLVVCGAALGNCPIFWCQAGSAYPYNQWAVQIRMCQWFFMVGRAWKGHCLSPVSTWRWLGISYACIFGHKRRFPYSYSQSHPYFTYYLPIQRSTAETVSSKTRRGGRGLPLWYLKLAFLHGGQGEREERQTTAE